MIDWGDFPTWLEAVATTGVLIAAGLAARAAGRLLTVARDRDCEQREATERTQAERIAAWRAIVPRDPRGVGLAVGWDAAVRNASELPVYQLHVQHVPIAPGGADAAVVVEQCRGEAVDRARPSRLATARSEPRVASCFLRAVLDRPGQLDDGGACGPDVADRNVD